MAPIKGRHFPCAHCGEDFWVIPSEERMGKRFCSMPCRDAAKRAAGHGYNGNVTNGLHHSRTYSSWNSMKQRCRNPRATSFYNYGARGIDYCDRWERLENFLADMGERPEGKSLDRIDNDAGYGPDNCAWATRSEQRRNFRGSAFLAYQGEKILLMDLAARLGVERATLSHRVAAGWPEDDWGKPSLRPQGRRNTAPVAASATSCGGQSAL